MVRPGWIQETFRNKVSRTWPLAELVIMQTSRTTAQAPVLTPAPVLEVSGQSAATGVVQAQQGRVGSSLPPESIQHQGPAWAWLNCLSDSYMRA